MKRHNIISRLNRKNNMFLRNYMFFIGFFVFLYCLLNLHSDVSRAIPQLKTSAVLDYIQKRVFPSVDVVVLPPFVTGLQNESNYSVLSIMRFAPWVRRIHIFDKEHKESQNHAEYWKMYQKSRIVHFHQDISEYSLTSPFLTEHFLILKPHFLLTNYLFNWQMFMGNSPVLRSCNFGIVPMTRTIFNECCYVTLTPQNYISYAYRKALKDQVLIYQSNLDHSIAPCSGYPITTTKMITVFNEETIRGYFQFEEPQKTRVTPYEIVLIVGCYAALDLMYAIPDKYKNTIQIWVNIMDKSNATDRLSYLHRMIVCKNVFIEIEGAQVQWNTEKMAAEIMRKIRFMGNNENFKVHEVFSFAADKATNRYELSANIVANKLAAVYATPFSILSEVSPAQAKSPEFQRLKML